MLIVLTFQPPELDHCKPNPCQHGGDCVETDNGFKCHCQAQYQGLRCEGRYNVMPNTCTFQLMSIHVNIARRCRAPPKWMTKQCNRGWGRSTLLLFVSEKVALTWVTYPTSNFATTPPCLVYINQLTLSCWLQQFPSSCVPIETILGLDSGLHSHVYFTSIRSTLPMTLTSINNFSLIYINSKVIIILSFQFQIWTCVFQTHVRTEDSAWVTREVISAYVFLDTKEKAVKVGI